MQSDTSLHDSTLKWWDGCEANTLPFNEGLSLAPFFSLLFPLFVPPTMSHFLSSLPVPLLPGSLDEGGGVTVHTKRPFPVTGSVLSEVPTCQRSDLLITAGCGWKGEVELEGCFDSVSAPQSVSLKSGVMGDFGSIIWTG